MGNKTGVRVCRLHKILFAAGLLCLLCGLTACAARVHADISGYDTVPIAVAGLTEEEFTVTAGELAALPCVKASARGTSTKAGTVMGIGPTMETFLAQYDRTIEEFKKIRFICADGYVVVLKNEYLTDYDIVLSVCSGGEPLPELQQPMRVVIPEAESGKWAYGVVRIEFVEDS